MHEPLDASPAPNDRDDENPCFCTCKEPQQAGEEVPADQLGTYAAVFYDIGGEPAPNGTPPVPPAST